MFIEFDLSLSYREMSYFSYKKSCYENLGDEIFKTEVSNIERVVVTCHRYFLQDIEAKYYIDLALVPHY